jgi:hypothetical protein
LNIIGTCTSGTSASSYVVNATVGNIVINMTGNITTGAAVAIRCTIASSTVNITGNSTGGTTATASAVSVVGTSAINVTGDCTGSTGPALLTTATTSPFSVTGTVTAGAYNAIESMGTVTVSGPLVNSNTHMAVYAPNIKLFAASNVTWTFKNESNVNKLMYTAGVALGNPTPANVRSGTNYGASLELTGTLAVPNPANVLLGVSTDNTTGTFSTTPSAIAAQVRVELATELARIDAAISSRLASASYTAPANSDITDIKKNTDLIPAAI